MTLRARNMRARRESLAALMMALGVLILTQAPYLASELWKPEGTFFVGHPYPLDTNHYFGQMLQGARKGVLFYHNHLTTEEHQPAIVFNFYLVLGKLAGVLGLDFVAAFHLARLLIGLALILFLHRASFHFFTRSYERLGFLALVCFSSGFRAISESNTFRAILYFPHFAASYLLLAAYFLHFALFGLRARAPTRSLAVCLFAIFLTAIIHPWNLITMALGSAAFLAFFLARKAPAWSRKHLSGYLSLVALAAGMTGLHLWTQHTNPVFAALAAQNVMKSEGPQTAINSFGLLWPLAIAGGVLAALRFRRCPFVFPALWAAAGCALVLAPSAFQRRFYEGLHVPIVLLAAFVLFDSARRIATKKALNRRRCVIAATVATLAATVPFNVASLRFPCLTTDPSALYYPPEPTRGAMRWVDAHVPENSNVMASVATGQLLCRYTLANAFVVHSVATVDFAKKRDWMMWFYSGAASPDDMRRFLRMRNIRYVFYGPWEQFSPDFDPSRFPWLHLIHTEAEIQVFETL